MLDIRAFEGVDDVFDVTTDWPYSDGSITYIYAEHFLEHLSFSQAIDFLVHAGNALQKNGVIRLTTPALEWVVKTHFSFEEKTQGGKITQTWGINRAFHGWGHKFLYSKEMREGILRGVGFSEIKFHNFGESDIPELTNFEQHSGWRITEWGFPTVWVIEARKNNDTLNISSNFLDEAKDTYIKYVESDH